MIHGEQKNKDTRMQCDNDFGKLEKDADGRL